MEEKSINITEYKDGDILYVKGNLCSFVFIKKGDGSGENLTLYHAVMYYTSGAIVIQNAEHPVCDSKVAVKTLRYATEAEKKRFIINLREEGWIWNADKRELEFVGQLKKQSLKVFDRVLVRDDDDECWNAAIFSHFEESDPNYPYRAMSIASNCWRQCIPYDGNEHLLGTTNAPE